MTIRDLATLLEPSWDTKPMFSDSLLLTITTASTVIIGALNGVS
jgi:hypothetical protein